MGFYDIRIKRLALLLIPPRLRKPVLAGLVQHLVQGVNMLYCSFMTWREEKRYRLHHTGQVCYLRAAVNDAFDPEFRRITVEDDANVQERRIFLREEGRSPLLPLRESGEAEIINRRGFGGANGYDFWVTIPMEIKDEIDEDKLRAVVNTYRLASKRWIINYK